MQELKDKTIYIVTAGEYSDYHIEAVFSTIKKAKEFTQQNGSEYRIEEYKLDAQFERGAKLWCVTIDVDNSEILQANARPNERDESVERLKDLCVIRNYLRQKRCELYIVTDTMDRATKIAKERYFALKANHYIWSKMNKDESYRSCGYTFSSLKVYPYFNFVTNEFIKDE